MIDLARVLTSFCADEACGKTIPCRIGTRRLVEIGERFTRGTPKPTDINRLIYGVEEMIRRTVGPHIEVEVVGQAGLWAARIDPAQLESALINLCINARDAMPTGGRITIETSNATLDRDYVESQEDEIAAGDYVMLSVSATGDGMPPDVAERAFEPFFTTKLAGQGTGLGLSQVYGFVKQSGGHIKIYSETGQAETGKTGQGTTVRLYLPRGGRPTTIDPAARSCRPRRSSSMITAGTSSASSAPRNSPLSTPMAPPSDAETQRIRASDMPGVCPKRPMKSALNPISTTTGGQATIRGSA